MAMWYSTPGAYYNQAAAARMNSGGGSMGLNGGGGNVGRTLKEVIERATPNPLFTEQLNKLNSFMTDPFSNITGLLEPLLEQFGAGEDSARQELADTFRAAGAQRSGAYGKSASMLEGDLAGKRGSFISDSVLKFLAPMLQGHVGALGAIPSSVEKTSREQGQSFSPFSGGGGAHSVGGGVGRMGGGSTWASPVGYNTANPFGNQVDFNSMPGNVGGWGFDPRRGGS